MIDHSSGQALTGNPPVLRLFVRKRVENRGLQVLAGPLLCGPPEFLVRTKNSRCRWRLGEGRARDPAQAVVDMTDHRRLATPPAAIIGSGSTASEPKSAQVAVEVEGAPR